MSRAELDPAPPIGAARLADRLHRRVRRVAQGIHRQHRGPGRGPFRNPDVGGDLHHYVWGIGMVSGVGGVAVHGDSATRRHPFVAVSYGAGLALIVDEFALLLDLKDVYWAKEGRISVDLGIGASSLAGTYFAALPLFRALRHRRRKAAPDPLADPLAGPTP